MIKITEIETGGWAAAFRGMRNPMNSWDKRDSFFGLADSDYAYSLIEDFVFKQLPYDDNSTDKEYDNKHDEEVEKLQDYYQQGILRFDDIGPDVATCAIIGPEDMKLAQKLVLAGTDDSKFMRQINISMDIDAPLYWWKEMDTYKVGTVANSCSTMHKLASTPITPVCFSLEEVDETYMCTECSNTKPLVDVLCGVLENFRLRYAETQDKHYWRALIQLLPASWNQKRTWSANYQVLRNIYFARRNHKLQEWRDFCKMIEKLPWAKELICIEKYATKEEIMNIFGPISHLPEEVEKEANRRFEDKCIPLGINISDL